MTEKQERAWKEIKSSKELFIPAELAAKVIPCDAQGLRDFIRDSGLINYIGSGNSVYICRAPFIKYVAGE